MKVLDVILAAATELGMEARVRAYLEGESTEGETDARTLLRCFNLIENELALDYLPLFAEDALETETGALEFGSFKYKVARIIKLTDENGESVPFKVFPTHIKTQAGKWFIRYAYIPEEKSFTDESDYAVGASVLLFVYGIVAEYLLAAGAFEESAVWDKKYKETIAAAYRAKPASRIASRRWF